MISFKSDVVYFVSTLSIWFKDLVSCLSLRYFIISFFLCSQYSNSSLIKLSSVSIFNSLDFKSVHCPSLRSNFFSSLNWSKDVVISVKSHFLDNSSSATNINLNILSFSRVVFLLPQQ